MGTPTTHGETQTQDGGRRNTPFQVSATRSTLPKAVAGGRGLNVSAVCGWLSELPLPRPDRIQSTCQSGWTVFGGTAHSFGRGLVASGALKYPYRSVCIEGHERRQDKNDCDRKTASEDELSFTLGEEELRRLLTKQFHEDSVRRYGSGGEQARGLSQLLVRC